MYLYVGVVTAVVIRVAKQNTYFNSWICICDADFITNEVIFNYSGTAEVVWLVRFWLHQFLTKKENLKKG